MIYFYYLVFPPQAAPRVLLLIQTALVAALLHHEVVVAHFRPPAPLSPSLPPADAPALVVARPVAAVGLLLPPPPVSLVVALLPCRARGKSLVVLARAVAPLVVVVVVDFEPVLLAASRLRFQI